LHCTRRRQSKAVTINVRINRLQIYMYKYITTTIHLYNVLYCMYTHVGYRGRYSTIYIYTYISYQLFITLFRIYIRANNKGTVIAHVLMTPLYSTKRCGIKITTAYPTRIPCTYRARIYIYTCIIIVVMYIIRKW
jgi:hypothetical protein